MNLIILFTKWINFLNVSLKYDSAHNNHPYVTEYYKMYRQKMFCFLFFSILYIVWRVLLFPLAMILISLSIANRWLSKSRLTSCAGMTCHARREFFVPNCNIFSVLMKKVVSVEKPKRTEWVSRCQRAKWASREREKTASWELREREKRVNWELRV